MRCATIRRAWLRWAVVAVIFTWCAVFVDFGAVLRIVSGVPVQWIVCALVLITIDRWLMAWKWLILLRALDVQTTFKTVLRLYYQGTLSGIFLPNSFGGDLLRAYWTSESAGATHRVYASLAMEKAIGLLSAVNWAFIGGSVFALSGWHEASITWIATTLVAVLLVNGLFVLSLHPYSRAFIMQRPGCRSGSRVIAFSQHLYEAYCEYAQYRTALVSNGLLTFAEHSLQMFIFLILSWGLGIQVGVVLFLAVSAMHLLFYRVPISPNGWGVGEVTAIGLYGLIGVSSESAFSLAFLAHVLQVIAVVPGLWFLWRPEQIRRSSREFLATRDITK